MQISRNRNRTIILLTSKVLSMKRLYTILVVAVIAMSVTNASAQQLPNAGFEGTWNISVPWTSDGNTVEMTDAYNPESWCISHVIGINGLGATVTGEKTAEGYNNSASAVRLINSPNSLLSTQIVPGYMTLGTTWSTSEMGSENDGGSFGGSPFTFKPDAISFQYKREHGTATEGMTAEELATLKPEEPATVVTYLWKGEWSQADVPAAIGIFTPTTTTMTDRDRNILDMETAKGGEVTHSDDAKLIASLNYSITEDATDWTKFEQPLNYVSDATPTKINVILAANDYFAGAEAVGRGNTLIVDDVKLVYYSRLNSVKINGAAVEGFDKDTYTYQVGAACPADESAFEVEVLGKSAEYTVNIDADNKVATVKVTNIDADSDGLKEHTYTFNFAGAQQTAIKYVGTLVVSFGVDTTIPNSELFITPNSASTCTMALYDFAFMGATVGDIIVDNISTSTEADGTIKYSGSKEGLQLSLEGNPLIANVNVTGTETATGQLTMNIAVNVPGLGDIPVTFNGQKDTTGIGTIVDDDNAPVEFFNLNGIRVDSENLAPGIYIKRQGRKVSKILIRK